MEVAEKENVVLNAWMAGCFLGLACGIACMALFGYFCRRRCLQRIRLATIVHSFSRMAPADARRLFLKHSYPPWVVFPTCEKLDWVNKEIAKVWPFLEQAASVCLAAWMESTIASYEDENLVSFKFQKFMLGPVPLQIFEIEKVKTRHDEITVEFDVQWIGNPTIIFEVELASGSSFPIQLRDVNIHGRMLFTFKPLAEGMPCIQAFMYTIKDLRTFHINLKGVPGVAYPIPGLFRMVEKSIEAAIVDTLVWPMRRIVEIVPGHRRGLSYKLFRELEVQVSGILRVKVVEARNLLNKDIIGKSDPFAVLYIRPIPARMKRTKTINNDLMPIWNETFNFEVEDLPTQCLYIKVLDDDGVQEAELLGWARFELKILKPGELRDLWIPLVKDLHATPTSSMKYRGEIHLELCYISSNEDLLKPLVSLTTPRSSTTKQLTSVERIFSRRSSSVKNVLSPSNRLESRVIRGILSISVLRANGLMLQNLRKKLNTYVVLKMKKSQAVLRTKVVENTSQPEWNTMFHIVIEDALHDMLILEVWNHKLFKEKFLGKCALTVTTLLLNNNKDMEVELQKGEATAGKVVLRLEWLDITASDPQLW